MQQVLAQTAADVCGEGGDRWLCNLVYDRTGNEVLAWFARFAEVGTSILLIIVVAFTLSRLSRRLVTRFAVRMEARIEERLDRAAHRGAISDTQRFRTRRFQRLHAITGVMRGVVAVVIWLTAVIVVLAQLNVPLGPLITGAGLAGVILGFGAQQLVRDVIAGIAMLIEDQYGVGDWVEVDGQIGEVERVGLRSTAVRDINGTVHHVLNGYLQRVGNLSQGWARATFDVPLALETDIPTARIVIWEVAEQLTLDPDWRNDVIGPPEIWGVQHFGPDGLQIRVVIPTRPLRNWQVIRQLRERLKPALLANGIRMPAQLLDVGGSADGHAVLTHETSSDRRRRQPRPRPQAATDPASATPRYPISELGMDVDREYRPEDRDVSEEER